VVEIRAEQLQLVDVLPPELPAQVIVLSHADRQQLTPIDALLLAIIVAIDRVPSAMPL
jgi:hypothetical protein